MSDTICRFPVAGIACNEPERAERSDVEKNILSKLLSLLRPSNCLTRKAPQDQEVKSAASIGEQSSAFVVVKSERDFRRRVFSQAIREDPA